jgi:carbon-monoxide dehydrogenase large subunit
MTAAREKSETFSALDRPNSYIGKTVPRPNLDRLMQGRGLYVSDIELPRMAHVVFLRSPHAHAKIKGIDASAAKQMPGVIAVVSGEELSTIITPWIGVLSHLKGLKSAPQSAIAVDRVCWQGEAVAAVVASSRAQAEDAAELVAVEYQELDAVTDMRTALDPATAVIHASLGGRVCFRAAYRRDARAALGRGRLECRGSQIDHLSGHAGAAYGAEHCRTSSWFDGIPGSRGL